MTRTTLNLLVDGLSLAAFMVLASTGVVLNWTLPPGSGRLDAAGCLPGRDVLVLWGWSRHEWGAFHLWAAYLFLGALALHLGLHWRWLKVTLARQAPTGYSGRRFLVGAGALILLAATLSPLLGRPQTVSRNPLPNASGEALYERHCQSCHGAAHNLARLPADPEAALKKLRGARPESSHAQLRAMSSTDLTALRDYLFTLE